MLSYFELKPSVKIWKAILNGKMATKSQCGWERNADEMKISLVKRWIDFRCLGFIEFTSFCLYYTFRFVLFLFIYLSMGWFPQHPLSAHVTSSILLFSYGSNVFKTHYEHVFIFDFIPYSTNTLTMRVPAFLSISTFLLSLFRSSAFLWLWQ